MNESDSHATLFIQFAGQGVKYMADLRRLFNDCPKIRPFIFDAIETIKRQAVEYDDTHSRFFNHGLSVDRWLQYPAEEPELSYLLSSPLSHPLIFLSQIAAYISVLQEGVDQDCLLAHTHSVTGFSTGIVAAVLVAMGLPLDDLINWALKVQALFFWQGIRTQQSMLNFGVRPQLTDELYHSPEGSPSCMASVNRINRQNLDAAIEQFRPRGDIYIAYELFPWRWIVSGLPNHLAAFKSAMQTAHPDCEWRYIPSTIGAHSPLLAYALETSPRDAERLGLHFHGVEMKIPVWSNDTGEDLRQSQDILKDIMRAYFICPAAWRKQIKPVLPPTRIKYVLDFGPGPGVASLTENNTKKTGIKVIRSSIPMGRDILFGEVVPHIQ